MLPKATIGSRNGRDMTEIIEKVNNLIEEKYHKAKKNSSENLNQTVSVQYIKHNKSQRT